MLQRRAASGRYIRTGILPRVLLCWCFRSLAQRCFLNRCFLISHCTVQTRRSHCSWRGIFPHCADNILHLHHSEHLILGVYCGQRQHYYTARSVAILQLRNRLSHRNESDAIRISVGGSQCHDKRETCAHLTTMTVCVTIYDTAGVAPMGNISIICTAGHKSRALQNLFII